MSKKILIIDDEKDFIKLLKLNLEAKGGYEVLALLHANDIIEQVHKFLPEIILLDILMPGIKGLEACEMLNQDPVGSEIPIIILSALNKDIDKLKAYKVGAVDYLEKPIEIGYLVEKIEKHLKLKSPKQ